MRIETGLDGAVVGAIERHYKHAREKHPYFCDRILPEESEELTELDSLRAVQSSLSAIRRVISDGAENGQLAAFTVAQCEMLEFVESVMMGDTAAAVEEMHDVIAVCLGIIDVLEGRQALGRPKESEVA